MSNATQKLVELSGLKSEDEAWIEAQTFKGTLRGMIAIDLVQVLDRINSNDRLIESEKARLLEATLRQELAALFDHTWITDHSQKLKKAGDLGQQLTEKAVMLARYLKTAREES